MVNSVGVATVYRHVKVDLIKLNKCHPFSTALETRAWNFSSLSINTPNSFSIRFPSGILISDSSYLEVLFGGFGFIET